MMTIGEIPLTEESVKESSYQEIQRMGLEVGADPFFKIVYLFPHKQQDLRSASLFGMFTPGILATARPILSASTLPADIREAHTSLDNVLAFRLLGSIWPLLLPVKIDDMEEVINMISSRFIVCISTDPDVADRTDEISRAQPTPILHVSTVVGSGRTPLSGLTLETICTYVHKVLNVMALEPAWQAFVRECHQIFAARPQRKLHKHRLKLAIHNVTRPNELALGAFGFKLAAGKMVATQRGPIGEGRSALYVNRICRSADAVASERTKLLSGRSRWLQDHRLILGVASTHARMYSTWKNIAQKAPEEYRRDFKRALAFVIRQTSYFHEFPVNVKGEPIFGPVSTMVATMLSADMRAFTAGLAMISTATLCPVLRLEPKVNQVRPAAAELARCTRANGRHRAWKQSRMVRLMGQKMRSLVHPEFLERIDAPEKTLIEGMKLVTDLPLELMPSGGMPLGLRFDVSRLSPVPGNMFWQTCNLQPITIPAEKFYNVLIVRSFQPNDPIRGVLQGAIRVCEDNQPFKNVTYRFVDVTTPDEFCAAVNSFEGAVMIFDGHGRYDPALGIGRLVVGGQAMDTWALKRLCKLPPVVMFSACDTQPIEGSHGSVATAAFALDARAVLGTILPVNAIAASRMMARMMLRLEQFVPIAKKVMPIVNWRHVVSGMLRMSHTAEATRALSTRAELDLRPDAWSRVQLIANNDINAWNPAWYDNWIDALAKEAKRSMQEIRVLLEKQVGLTDAMKYVQLGNPERVIIG